MLCGGSADLISMPPFASSRFSAGATALGAGAGSSDLRPSDLRPSGLVSAAAPSGLDAESVGFEAEVSGAGKTGADIFVLAACVGISAACADVAGDGVSAGCVDVDGDGVSLALGGFVSDCVSERLFLLVSWVMFCLA